MSETYNTFPLPNKKQYFRELTRTPIISWPALGLFVLGMTIVVSASVMTLSGATPLWAAMIANGLALYLLFSIMHESLHRSVSSNTRLNNTLGRISLMLLIPAAPLEIARWAHFRHHRFTNGDRDPDNFIHHAKWWEIPFKWPNFDLYYLYCFLQESGEQRKRHTPALISAAAVFVSVVGTLTYLGYGMEVLFLWILPSRIALALIALVFVWLPHYPADITSEDNVYEATTIRRGWEWLLTPLFVYQNYHLIHHLYPGAPFYNYIKIWHLRYDELIAQEPAIQKDFGLVPLNHDRARRPSPDGLDPSKANNNYFDGEPQ